MKLKDKLKAAAIATTTFILASCGHGKEKAPEVEERSSDQPAMGLPRYHPSNRANFHEDTPVSHHFYDNGDFIDIDYAQLDDAEKYYSNHSDISDQHDVLERIDELRKIPERYKGDSACQEIINKLKEANIPIAKEDSILHDVEISSDNGKIKLSNPHYALNRKVRAVRPNNSKTIDGIEIKEKINPENLVETYQVDDKTIGVKSWKTEFIHEKFSSVRKLVNNQKTEAKLHEGDTIIVRNQNGTSEAAIVEQDGVSPTKEDKFVKCTPVTKVIFDYNAKQPE